MRHDWKREHFDDENTTQWRCWNCDLIAHNLRVEDQPPDQTSLYYNARGIKPSALNQTCEEIIVEDILYS